MASIPTTHHFNLNVMPSIYIHHFPNPSSWKSRHKPLLGCLHTSQNFPLSLTQKPMKTLNQKYNLKSLLWSFQPLLFPQPFHIFFPCFNPLISACIKAHPWKRSLEENQIKRPPQSPWSSRISLKNQAPFSSKVKYDTYLNLTLILSPFNPIFFHINPHTFLVEINT